jgi:hypothetical protein
LPKRLAINLLQDQPQLDDLVRENDRTTPVYGGGLIRGPFGSEVVSEIDGQAAAIGQFTIIFSPVHFLFEKAHKGHVHLNAFI